MVSFDCCARKVSIFSICFAALTFGNLIAALPDKFTQMDPKEVPGQGSKVEATIRKRVPNSHALGLREKSLEDNRMRGGFGFDNPWTNRLQKKSVINEPRPDNDIFQFFRHIHSNLLPQHGKVSIDNERDRRSFLKLLEVLSSKLQTSRSTANFNGANDFEVDYVEKEPIDLVYLGDSSPAIYVAEDTPASNGRTENFKDDWPAEPIALYRF